MRGPSTSACGTLLLATASGLAFRALRDELATQTNGCELTTFRLEIRERVTAFCLVSLHTA